MGKRKSITWEHYTSSHKNGVEYGTCKYCPAVFRRNATRMTQHLLYKCEEVPAEVVRLMEHHFPHIPKRDYTAEYHPWPEVEIRKHQSDGSNIADGHAGTGTSDVLYEVMEDREVEMEPESETVDLEQAESPDLPTTASGSPLKRKRHSSPASSEASSSSSMLRTASPKPKRLFLMRKEKASAARAALQSLSRKLTPMLDRVIVQKADAVTKTRGGIVIPEKAQGKVLEGTIIAVGPGARNDRGEHVPVGVIVGDTVILPEYGGTKVEIDEKELFIYREHDILAKVDKA